jgi:UDP-N-acetylglucosamine 1-carboxyvinyltransferase
MTVLTKAEKDSRIVERIFENRFGIADELNRLGADIKVKDRQAYITGSRSLCGHTVKASDLRQGAALVVAGMISKGYTTVTDISYIERGYEDIVRDLQGVGVQISYV